MSKQIMVTLNDEAVVAVNKLLATRSNKTFEQLVQDLTRTGIENALYRQERNRRVNQERKEADLTIRGLRDQLAHLQRQ